jgi:hypothetical protein
MVEAAIRVGKTTLAGLLLRAMIFGGDVLGYPVRRLQPGERILYLALDRPEQIKRALLRQFTPEQIAQLPEHLSIWEGPLPADAAESVDVLLDAAEHYWQMGSHRGLVRVVFLDTVKDAAVGLSDEKVGQRYNQARQRLLAGDHRQLVELHHLTKGGDAYGSTFLHAGAGSVLRLSGKVGAATATLTHILPVADVVGPLRLTVDHAAGEITVRTDRPKAAAEDDGEPDAAAVEDLVSWAIGQGQGVTARDAAVFLYGAAGRAEVARAQRALNDCAELRRAAGAAGRGNSTRWLYDDGGDE